LRSSGAAPELHDVAWTSLRTELNLPSWGGQDPVTGFFVANAIWTFIPWNLDDTLKYPDANGGR